MVGGLIRLRRSLQNFEINQPRDRMPPTVIKAFGLLKGAAAAVNVKHGALGMYRISGAFDLAETLR